MPTPGNALDITSAGLVKFDGTATFSGVTTTQFDVLVGAASNGISNIAPSATSGVPLISQGSSSNPAFGTAVVAGGGTGNTTFTAYSVICAGTTATGIFQNVSGVGSSGQVLTSNGASALPTWQNTGSFVWTDEGTNFNALAQNGYFITATCTATLPASPSQGNQISFTIDAATTTVTITANTGQIIRIGTGVSASAGTAANNARGDSVTLVFRSSDSAWIASSVIGTWIVT